MPHSIPATYQGTPDMLLSQTWSSKKKSGKHAEHVMIGNDYQSCFFFFFGFGTACCRCIAISPKAIAAATSAAMNSLLRLGRRRQGLLACARAFATEAGALEAPAPKKSQPPGDSPFLRFATPLPQPTNHQQIFSTIPQTQVRCLPILYICCTIRLYA